MKETVRAALEAELRRVRENLASAERTLEDARRQHETYVLRVANWKRQEKELTEALAA